MNGLRSLWLGVGALSCALAWAEPSAAQEVGVEAAAAARSVRLRFDAADTSRALATAVTRLSAELRVAGFDVVNAVEVNGDSYGDVEIRASDGRLRLEITSTAQGASSHVVLVGTESEVGGLALQATEFLRAGLSPRAVVPAAAPEKAASEAPTPVALALRGRLFLDAGAGLLTNWRAGDVLPLFSLGGGYEFPERIALSVAGDVPLGTATFDAQRGSADYRQWLGGLQADYAWLRGNSGQLTIGSYVGVARTSSSGRPEAPLRARGESSWALALGARLGGELKLTSFASLVVQARVLGLSPNPLVDVIGETRRLGSPSIALNLGVRIAP